MSECPYGCLIEDGRLLGDCRIPWGSDCFLRRRGQDDDRRPDLE